MKVGIKSIVLMTSIITLTGCGGLIDWADTTFTGGKKHKQHTKLINQHSKSLRIYDQFSTVAFFDVLWLSDAMRTIYVQSHAKMSGRKQAPYETLLRRQLKANEHFVSFYVLSTHENPLNSTPPLWALYLKIGKETYQPQTLKIIDLSIEYKNFFGELLTNHKTCYEVVFERQDFNGKDILAGAESIELVFSNAKYYESVVWDYDLNNASVSIEEEG